MKKTRRSFLKLITGFLALLAGGVRALAGALPLDPSEGVGDDGPVMEVVPHYSVYWDPAAGHDTPLIFPTKSVTLEELKYMTSPGAFRAEYQLDPLDFPAVFSNVETSPVQRSAVRLPGNPLRDGDILYNPRTQSKFEAKVLTVAPEATHQVVELDGSGGAMAFDDIRKDDRLYLIGTHWDETAFSSRWTRHS